MAPRMPGRVSAAAANGGWRLVGLPTQEPKSPRAREPNSPRAEEPKRPSIAGRLGRLSDPSRPAIEGFSCLANQEMRRPRGSNELPALIPQRRQVHSVQQMLPRPEQRGPHRNVHLVDQLRLQVLPNRAHASA
jgi:hypothetical protein